MTTRSSSTAVATSDIVERLAGVIREGNDSRTDQQLARVSRLVSRIQDLEARGFIRRQQYGAPRAGDFEKLMLCKRDPSRILDAGLNP